MKAKEGSVQKGNMPLKIAADWLVKHLKEDGYIIQRYDALSFTMKKNSIDKS